MIKDQKAPPFFSAESLFLSFLGIGYVRWAPGTFGSLATIPFLYLYGSLNLPIFLIFPFLILTTIGSILVTDSVQRKYKLKDPSWIVIDEVLGMIVTWVFFPSSSLLHLFCAFALFRFFDIVKVYPANYFDQRMQHGAGVIIDDLISALYAGLCYWLLNYFQLLHF